MNYKTNKSSTLKTCLQGALLAAIPVMSLSAQTVPDARLEKLEQENNALKKRLDAIEDLAIKEGVISKGGADTGAVKALGDITLSGFVTASYFWDTSDPEAPAGGNVGAIWNRNNGSFSINKVKLTLASKPVEASGDTFDAGFRASLIFGDDAPIVNTGGVAQGMDELREAYVEMNVPIGTGLNVKAGHLISLMNYESGDGGAANSNFSQGYQWLYTGNGPSTGVQLGYAITDKIDVKVRVQNGFYGGTVDANVGKCIMASIGIKPTDSVWVSLVGFHSKGDIGINTVQGGEILAGWKVTDKLSLATELDYFDFDTGGVGGSAMWSIGGWATYDLTEKVGLALRTEFLCDRDGFGFVATPPPAVPAFVANPGQDIASIAFTLNLKPAPNIKIQPEIRYDHSTMVNAFGRSADRFILGAGISYLF